MTHPISPSSFFEILDIVKAEFEIEDAYVEEGVITVLITPSTLVREKIDDLRSRLGSHGYTIQVRAREKEIKLLIFALAPQPQPPRRRPRFNYPLILFIATIVSVTISGYLSTLGYLDVLRILGRIRPEDEVSFLWSQTALYTVSVMCIVGLHELGHTIACRINRVEASLPIFIPGIPGITPGTFGAVIMQKGPAQNRDQLFDIGITGPLVGFVTALIVSYFGYSLSLPVSRAEYELITSTIGPSQVFFPPLLFMVLESYLLPSPTSFTFFAHPLAFAGWIGTLITFLNVFPIGQLDGGHVARAVLGRRGHRILSYVAVIVMFLTGWWSMALLTMLLIRFEHPGALDEITPLSKTRKILALLVVIIFISCLTFSPESPIAFLLWG